MGRQYSRTPVADATRSFERAPSVFEISRGSVGRMIDPIIYPVDYYLYGKEEADKNIYMKDLADRKAVELATTGQIIGGEIINPITAAPVFNVFKAKNAISAASNLAITSGAITGTEELLRSRTLPNYNPQEGYINTAVSTASGFVFGRGLYAVGEAVQKMQGSHYRKIQDHSQLIDEIDHFQKNEKVLAARLKNERKFSDKTDLNLRDDAKALKMDTDAAQQGLDKILSGETKLEVQDQIDAAINTLQAKISNNISKRNELLDELTMRRLDRGASSLDDPYNIASSAFDIVDFMPTPATTIYKYKIDKKFSKTKKQALNNFKKITAMLVDDGSMLFAGSRFGLTLDRSVDTRNKLAKATLYGIERDLTELWRVSTNAPKFAPNTIRRITKSGISRDDWASSVVKKRILNDPNMTPEEKQAAEILNKYFDDVLRVSEDYQTIGSSRFNESYSVYLELRLKNANERLLKLQNAKYKNEDAIEHYQKSIAKIEEDIQINKEAIEYIKSNNLRPIGPKEPFFTRQYAKDVIQADERGAKVFRSTVTSWVRSNPTGIEFDKKTKLWKPKDLTGDLEGQDRYVDEVIKAILSDSDPSDVNVTLRSTRMPSRSLSIPNSLILDFIETNPFVVLRSYNQKSSMKNNFAAVFGNRSFDDLISEATDDLIASGVSVKDAYMLRKNLTDLYKRVTATTLTDPTSLTNKSVQFLKEFTSLNYLGGAGVTAIGDIPKIIMEHGFKDTYKALLGSFDDPAWQKQLSEVKSVYAEALELSLGTVQQRVLEDTGVVSSNKVWTGIKDAGFILNALGPMTVGLKSLAGSLSAHRFIEISKGVASNKTSKFDIEYASRYGLEVKHMREIAEKAPIETTNQGLFVANITDWAQAGISADTITRYQAAVSKSVANTILSSTPATRFTYADGSVYAPIGWARKIFPNIEEHPEYPGYVRWESGVMTLPFQFYNYSMSAVSNILRTTAQGQTKHRFGGFALMLGIGYMMAKIRTPDWAWDDMDYDQRFIAAVERSGITAIAGDVAFNSIRTATQLGLNDPKNDFVQLPFYGRDGYSEAMTTILGAGSSTIKDTLDAGVALTQGEYAEAMKAFYLLLPLTEIFWWKEESRGMIDAVTNSIFENR